jgi:hypothetical protein
VKLKLDENLGRRWAEQLRDGGHDVHTVIDEGLSGSNDVDVLAASVAEERALATLDLDFANPIRAGRAELDGLVGRLAIALGEADLSGHLWIVERSRVRQYEEPSDTV